LEKHRTFSHGAQERLLDRLVVADQVQLGFAALREEDLGRARDRDFASGGFYQRYVVVHQERPKVTVSSGPAITALNAKIVVAGHRSVGAADLPENLAASQRYLRDFTTLAKKGGTVEDLVHGMLELHGELDQPHTLWISARAEVARRGAL
jgi:hypothetical protein